MTVKSVSGERSVGELGGNLDRALERAIERTVVGEHRMHALSGLALIGRGFQDKANMDPFDHQDVPLRLHLALHLTDQSLVIGWNLARLQRASKGADQSTSGGGNQ